MSPGESSGPRKAYHVELVGQVVKHAIVWANSVEDARRTYFEAGVDSEDVLVMDNEFHERGMRRPRRMPSEDR